MIPDASHPTWRALVTGELEHRFATAGAGLLMARMRRSVATNPSSENIAACIQETRTFFVKYESILMPDIARLFE
ncbi:hypothetical protein ACFL5O_02925 [Myxococcota bacterium]